MLYQLLLLSISATWNCEDGPLRQRFRTVESSGLWDCQRICTEHPECNLLGFLESEAGRICAITTGGGMIEATTLRMTICSKEHQIVNPVVEPEHHEPNREQVHLPEEPQKPIQEMEVIPVTEAVIPVNEVMPVVEQVLPVKEETNVVLPVTEPVLPVKEESTQPKITDESVQILPETVFDKSEDGEQTTKPVEEVSIPIETTGVDIIKWCSSDPECRTFGDLSAACHDSRCVCSHGFEPKSGFGICQSTRETLNPMHTIPTLVIISFHFVDTRKLSLEYKFVQELLLKVIKNIYPSTEVTSTASVVIGSTVAQFMYEIPLRVMDFVKIRTVPLRVSQSVGSTRFSKILGTHVAKSVSGIIKVNHLGVQASDCLAKGATKTFLAASEDESIEPQCVALECQQGMFLFYDPVANSSRCAPEFETRHRQQGLCLYDAECLPPKVCKSGICVQSSHNVVSVSQGDESFHFHALFLFTLTTFLVAGAFIYKRILAQKSGRSSPRWRQDLLGRY
eukprot:TRINITY_DN1671_c1_g1_i3.p1 TRINITY_DN1671_c1_g1~~TRINITY_DN1671_c1_g1_i3.p1  ORF type:complete len:509 (+),score=70.67 TRINITY_DN1671_c1_g1_i3:97-1623(+)